MGKRIISQARGKGSLTYRVRKKAFSRKIGYPQNEGVAEILEILHSAAHSAPLIKAAQENTKHFFIPAFVGAYTGQKISVGGEVKEGNVVRIKDVPVGAHIYNIERNPGDGGKMIRSAGSSAILNKKLENGTIVIAMPNKKEVKLNGECRATIGVIAGDGRLNKPFLKAGPKFHKMKAKSKLYPRVSAVCMNAIDHPFGSGRGKRIKPKIAKRNSSPGQKVGHLRPKRTGHKN